MKRYINLLPPEEQRQIALAQMTGSIFRFGLGLVVSLAALAVALLGAQFMFRRELGRVTADLAARTQALHELQTSTLRKDISTFNLDLKNFTTLAAGQQHWSDVLAEFAKLLPADLTLDTLTIDGGSGKVEVAGRGGTRRSVLQLRQNILGSRSFVNVNFPLKNLERANDTPWSYRFNLKK